MSTIHDPAAAPVTLPAHRETPQPHRNPPAKWRWLLIAVILAVLGTATFRIVQSRSAASKAEAQRSGMPPVPVIAGVVETKDVPIYLDGLGTAQALNTVTVRARVDGEIKKIDFTEGQDVRAGDLLVEIDAAPYRAAYDQALAKQGQDEAQLANAQADLERYSDLAGKKVISSQQLDTQRALVRQYDALVKADAAAVASAKVQLDYTQVVAPIDGRTGIRLVDQGNVVHATDPTGLVVLTQLQPISLIFTLPEQNLTTIDKEQVADGKLGVLAVDRDNKTVLEEGKLSVIDNQIDTTTGTIRLKATFPNAHLRLWPGQFVNARLLLAVREKAIVVRASVVQRGPQGAFAFVIKPDETVEMRPVKVGPIEQGQAVIDEGLAAGERVVVDGQYKLQPGSKVKAK
jgi:multidrug efflux system membrane fusion protein